jgi:5-methyltetrahydropteroyltriglutamate--homocysteine methyltransferase
MTKLGPFRADQVGSLLRPEPVKRARARYAAGQIDARALASVEDAAVDELVARQEAIGLRAVTDGETRRENWSLDFLSHLEGVKVIEMAAAPTGHGSAAPLSSVLKVARVVGKVGLSGHPMLEHFRYLREHTRAVAKMTIPSPTMMVSASRDWRQVIDPNAYSDLDEFLADMAAAYRNFMLLSFDAGCRYLQLDDVNLAYLCDSDMRAKIVARGDDPKAMLSSWVKALQIVLAARPAGMVVTTHVCRGNFKSAWFAQGGYEPIAEVLFNELDYDGYFLEYDSERAGGFEPLRFVPKGRKRVVLGLVTSKIGELESADLLKSRIEAASRYVDPAQLCLSPQCGFASHEDGNHLSEQAQWAKLQRVVDVAREMWTDA